MSLTALEIARLGELHPILRERLAAVLRDLGPALRPDGLEAYLAEAWRSDAQAAINWAKGRRQLPDGSWVVVKRQAIITWTQHTKHNRNPALAADVWIRDRGTHRPYWLRVNSPPHVREAYHTLGLVCDAHRLVRPLAKDPYHIELPPTETMS